MSNYQVFVYGTLKYGYGNNHILKEGEGSFERIGAGVVKNHVLCYSYGRQGFPVALRTKNRRDTIVGEIWSFEDIGVLRRLDRLEGEGSMYNRRTVEVVPLQDDPDLERITEAFMYVGNENCWMSLYQNPAPHLCPIDQFDNFYWNGGKI